MKRSGSGSGSKRVGARARAYTGARAGAGMGARTQEVAARGGSRSNTLKQYSEVEQYSNAAIH